MDELDKSKAIGRKLSKAILVDEAKYLKKKQETLPHIAHEKSQLKIVDADYFDIHGKQEEV